MPALVPADLTASRAPGRLVGLVGLVLFACTSSPPKDSGDDTDSGGDTASSSWASVTAGLFVSCGIHLDGGVECWGLDGVELVEDTGHLGYFDSGVNVPPAGDFQSLSLVIGTVNGSPGLHACGLHADGTVACWGRNDNGQIHAPDGVFVGVDVFDLGSCGLRASGEVVCWGEYYDGPSGAYQELSTGLVAAVALDADGSASSWWTAHVTGGKMPEIQEGPFTTVSVGGVACALRPDGTLFCWEPGFPEYEAEYAAVTPAGTFTAVSAGGNAACALKPDGHPVCFGLEADRPEYDVPDVSLTQISCGGYHVCGVTADHTVVCWGDNTYGQSTPPT